MDGRTNGWTEWQRHFLSCSSQLKKENKICTFSDEVPITCYKVSLLFITNILCKPFVETKQWFVWPRKGYNNNNNLWLRICYFISTISSILMAGLYLYSIRLCTLPSSNLPVSLYCFLLTETGLGCPKTTERRMFWDTLNRTCLPPFCVHLWDIDRV